MCCRLHNTKGVKVILETKVSDIVELRTTLIMYKANSSLLPHNFADTQKYCLLFKSVCVWNSLAHCFK